MDLREIQRNWEAFGRTDPYWAVLTDPGRKGGKWDEQEFHRTGEAEVARVMDLLHGFGLPTQSARALDFGCGLGRISIPLAQHFGEVTGVDIAPAMLAEAERRDSTKRCRFALNSRADLSLFPNGHFDLVYSRLVLQHMPPRFIRSYIREFVRVTRPGGAIIFQVPTTGLYQPPRRPIWRIVPPVLVRAIRRVKRLTRYALRLRAEPVMDDYGLERDEVERLLAGASARLLSTTRDDSHGPNRPGYEYLATRS